LQRTRLSSKGQIILPKSIRDARSWEAGIEPTHNGVVLRPAAAFPQTEMDQAAGCLTSQPGPVTSDRMRQGIEKEVRRRHDSGRTNVLVRLLTGDDPEQQAAARSDLDSENGSSGDGVGAPRPLQILGARNCQCSHQGFRRRVVTYPLGDTKCPQILNSARGVQRDRGIRFDQPLRWLKLSDPVDPGPAR
jgi:bifunctional DNA-binding transcriptional regulator/antitoxin component of YhaV-PrlF toxin-antitoxin module